MRMIWCGLLGCALLVVGGPLAARLAAAQTLETGPHHIRWRTTNQLQTAQGPINVPSEFVQMETGLNRWDQNTASWVVTDSRFELFQDGAILRNLQYSAIFTPSVADPGAIDILLPSGERMVGQIVGLAYTLGEQSLLVSEIKPCAGEINGNQLIFRSAFTDYDIDVVFKAERSGLSQWLTIKEQLPHPRAFFPEAQAEDVHVELLTEWTEAPVPAKESRIIEPGANGQHALTHERIRIGAAEFLAGRAFGLNGENSLPVCSSWETIQNRTFLLEKIPWRKLAPELQKLPAPQAAAGQVLPRVPAAPRPLPARRVAKARVKPIQVAQAPIQLANGVLWDWELAVSAPRQVWLPNATYYISGNCVVSTNEFWGNCVLKFAPTNSAKLTVTGPIITYADMYKPVTLTARDDHSIGAQIGSATLSGYYADTALYLDVFTSGLNYDLENFRIRYATCGVTYFGGGYHVLSHGSFVKCASAVSVYYGDISFRNMIVHDCTTAFGGSAACTNRAENTTFYQCTSVFNTANGTLALTNCVLAEVAFSGSIPYYSGENNFTYASGSDVFTTLGASKVYLKPGSTAIGAATTNITPGLLAALRQRTTAPPLILSNRITLDTVLTRAVQRDTDALDCGAHLPPIDYCVNNLPVYNATLLITNGVVIASFGANGIYLEDGAKLISMGGPLTPNHFTRYYSVQEQPTNWLGADPSTTRTLFTFWTNIPTSFDLRWTSFEVPSAGGYHLYSEGGYGSLTNATIRDCQFFGGGQLYLTDDNAGEISFTNSLFEYVDVFAGDMKYLRFHNNLFVGVAGFLIQNLTTNTWSFKDNLLDHSSLQNASPGMVHDYNAFYQSADFYSTYDTNANEKILASLSYDTGWLSRYYLPTNSALLNAGSLTNAALAGLYHYTVLTNQIPEFTNHLDISWHLPALHGTGMLLLDGDADGIPDAFEDRNGNATYDSAQGETDWSTYNSLFGIGSGPGLVVFTPLK